jgi:hypothetical protein
MLGIIGRFIMIDAITLYLMGLRLTRLVSAKSSREFCQSFPFKAIFLITRTFKEQKEFNKWKNKILILSLWKSEQNINSISEIVSFESELLLHIIQSNQLFFEVYQKSTKKFPRVLWNYMTIKPKELNWLIVKLDSLKYTEFFISVHSNQKIRRYWILVERWWNEK